MPTADAKFQTRRRRHEGVAADAAARRAASAPGRSVRAPKPGRGTAPRTPSSPRSSTKPTYLYHAVKDADTLFAAGKYAEAEAAYAAVVGDTSLQIWDEAKSERNELESYSLFRAGARGPRRPAAMRRRRTATSTARAATIRKPCTISSPARSRPGTTPRTASASAAPPSATTSQANLAEYQAFWDFGYANPPFDPAIICPF